jgi:ABC-2 type transport system permease protein
MTAVLDPTEVSRATRWRWTASDALTMTRRNLTHVRHVPEKLIDVTLQPLMFVLLFAYVFGNAIAVSDGSYREYLMAGIFVQTLAFAVAGTAVSIADDMAKGAVERFRSLPMSRSAVLVGRAVADLGASLIGLVVMCAAGVVVGWGIHSSVPEALAGFGLLLLFALAMAWVGTLLGLLVRAPDAAQGIAFVTLFPLTFGANAYVSVQDLPSALQTAADWNPLSAVITACRELFGNPTGLPADPAWPLAHPVTASILWCLATIAVCLPLAVRRYIAR